MNIEVVLTQDDPKLGKKGDVVKVSTGFAGNFLYPQKKAVPATTANRLAFERQKERLQKQEAERLEHARQLADKIGRLAITIEAMTAHSQSKTDEEPTEPEKLFGSITAAEILHALALQSVIVDKKDIHLEEPIRRLGQYDIAVKLHREVTATLKLTVTRKIAG
ncbi:MAG: 50S ribosomal protein L9 [Candidatus Omnitrophota bacterium]